MNPYGERVSSSQRILGMLFLTLAFLNYYGYLTRLYWRLGNAFGKKLLFKLGMILLPFVFLMLLGYRRENVFLHGTPIKLSKRRPKNGFAWSCGPFPHCFLYLKWLCFR